MTTTTLLERAADMVAAGELIRREAIVTRRADDATGREFTAIGVPYGDVIEHYFGTETFDRGAVELADPTVLLWRHGEVIGLITAGRDLEAGFEIDARISDTTLGREASTLLLDGVVRRMSIGFEPLEYRVDEEADVIHWTRVVAREFSLEPFAAYSGATVSTIRTSHRPPTTEGTEPTMSADTITRADLDAVNASLDEINRRVALVQANGRPAPAGAKWRSIGDFVKAVAAGDEDAAEFHRAYTGGTLDDAALADTFVGDFIKLARARRPFVDMFTTGALPDKGNSIDYRQLSTNTIAVGNQAAEGDNLTGPGKITLTRANAPVYTDGGWWELSRQEVQRGSGIEVGLSYEAGALAYAKFTNARVRSVLLARINALIAADAGDDTNALDMTLATATADTWLDAVIDAAEVYDDRGFALTGLATSKAVFKTLAHLKDGDHRLMTVTGAGVNQVGTINVPGLTGELARVTVRMMPGVPGNVATFYDPVAIKFLESSGAPAQLQDDEVVNLTKAFSVYGYNATLEPFPAALLPIEFA